MKKLHYLLALLLISIIILPTVLSFGETDTPIVQHTVTYPYELKTPAGFDYTPVRYFGPAGEDVSGVGRKVWRSIITPTSATHTISISTAGFTEITGITVTPMKNTANASDVPMVVVKSYTTTAVIVNIVEANTTLVSVIGVNVVGLRLASSITGVTFFINVTGK